MDEQRFDSLTASLSDMRGRRAALKYLVAAATAASGVGALAMDAGARRRRPPRPPVVVPPTTTPAPTTTVPPVVVPVTCQAGTSLGTVIVQGNGDAALTPILATGSRYQLRASGSVRSNATQSLDAEYQFLAANPLNSTDVIGTVDVGISIDGNQPNWGGYDRDHVYVVELNGQGKALTLKMQDANLADNSGTIQVEVLCAGAARSGLGRKIAPARGGKARAGRKGRKDRKSRGKHGK